MIEEKLDKILVDVAVIKTISSQHSAELADLKARLDPVFDHVTGSKWVLKMGGGLLAVITAVAGILAVILR